MPRNTDVPGQPLSQLLATSTILFQPCESLLPFSLPLLVLVQSFIHISLVLVEHRDPLQHEEGPASEVY